MSRKRSKLLKILISLVLTVSLFLPVTSTIAYADSSIYSNASEWAKLEIESASNSGVLPPMLKGKDMTKSATREELCELAVLLYEKLNGASVQTSGTNPFTDTSNMQVIKAYDLGITTGITSTSFAPNAITNREQVATMFGRAIQKLYPNMDYSETGAQTFIDKADISSWALSHVQYLSKEGIIKGDAGKFMPKAITEDQKQKGYGTTTREQAIAITVRVNSRYQGAVPGTVVAPIINKLALSSAISGAEANKATAVVNTASANVALGTDWVTQAVMNAYIDAIAAAQAVFNDVGATQPDADYAVVGLNIATISFDAAKQLGTKPLVTGISPGWKIPEIGISPGIKPGIGINPGILLEIEMTAQEAEDAGFKWENETIRKYTGIDKDVFIPSKIADVIITTIGKDAFWYKGLTSVAIPSSVTTIGINAFGGNKLTSVTIPNSVITIGDVAFQGNLLTSVTIPSSVTTIGVWAFEVNSLMSVTIPASVTVIGDGAFKNNGPNENSGDITTKPYAGTWKLNSNTPPQWIKQ